MKKSLITSIPTEKLNERKWSVKLNGQEISDVSLLKIENPKIGILSYGLTEGGYDGWSFRDMGGAVTILYCFYNHELLIGVIHQNRHNQGGYVWNVPRGFIDSGENLHATAKRELKEESGYSPGKNQIIQLPGEAANCNSTFFETLDEDNAVAFYAVEIDKSELYQEGNSILFNPDIIDNSDKSLQNRSLEMINGIKFVLWTEVAALADMFSNAAVARLLAYLRQNNKHSDLII